MIPETTLLAALDGVEYLLLTSPAVLAVRNDLVAYYCGGGEWDASPAAQEATRRTRITALEAELAQLRAAGPLLPAPPAADAEPRAACPHCGGTYKVRGLTRHLSKCPKRPARLTAPAEPEPAPIVEVISDVAHDPALPPLVEVVPPEPALAPADELYSCPQCERKFTTKRALEGHIGRVHVALARKAEAPPAAWTCATCGQGVGERSISDPTRCKACVRAANDAAPKASAALAATVARPKAEALAS